MCIVRFSQIFFYLGFVFLLIAPPAFSTTVNPQADLEALKDEGAFYQLLGQFEQVEQVRLKMLARFPNEPAAYVLNLNTIVIHLTWEETQTSFDECLRHDAELALQLELLIEKYPKNPRFHLRFPSVLIADHRYTRSLEVAHQLLSSNTSLTQLEKSLVNIWVARAQLGLGNVSQARLSANTIKLVDEQGKPVPEWSKAWCLSTRALLLDVDKQRNEAIELYKNILNLPNVTFVSKRVLDAARLGLNSPFKP